jgi:hypothetical protein
MKSMLELRQSQGLSRRTMLKTATGAALGVALGSLASATPPSQPIYYGKNTGQTPLDATNVFPLFAAWLLLTTNGPAETLDKATISKVANLDSRSTDQIWNQYSQNQQAFSDVRKAFGELAKTFASKLPYSGGQCPDDALTVAPVATLPCVKSKSKAQKTTK